MHFRVVTLPGVPDVYIFAVVALHGVPDEFCREQLAVARSPEAPAGVGHEVQGESVQCHGIWEEFGVRRGTITCVEEIRKICAAQPTISFQPDFGKKITDFL